MIEGINNNFSIDPLTKNDNSANKSMESFSSLFKKSIDEVNNLQLESDQITEDFALGKVDNIHDVTIAAEKARTALNLTVSIQNKVMDAYNELMRMQI
ncbi:MAG: flagellar hook-basal body complex protein FliE [Bacillota bacterium]